MRFLPVFMDVTSGPVALVGAGEHAVNKLRLLLAAHATVRWFPGHTDVADEIVQAAASPGHLEVDFHDPLSANLDGAIAVVSATGDARDETISARAREAGIPVNVVDRRTFPASCSRRSSIAATWSWRSAPAVIAGAGAALARAHRGDRARAYRRPRRLMGRYRRRVAEAVQSPRHSGRRSSTARSVRRCLPAAWCAPRPTSCAASTMATAVPRKARPAPCSWSAPARAIPIC